MSSYLGNHFAEVVQSRYFRSEGWAAFTCHPWAPPPQCAPDMTSIAFPIGAGYSEHVAPGFEYCLDAPVCMPAGSMQAVGFQPYSD